MSVDSSTVGFVGTQRCRYRTATSVVRARSLKIVRKNSINIPNQWKKLFVVLFLVVHDCELQIL